MHVLFFILYKKYSTETKERQRTRAEQHPAAVHRISMRTYISRVRENIYLAAVELIKLFDKIFCVAVGEKAVSAKILCKTNHPAGCFYPGGRTLLHHLLIDTDTMEWKNPAIVVAEILIPHTSVNWIREPEDGGALILLLIPV